jgi:hypothetical protein
MKDIFLSRPNWVSPVYTKGLEYFLNLLDSHELRPRTIGTTDFPNKSPMDEVIELLYKCEGAIIIGYPQIQINYGSIKDTPITEPISLSTEWNHIEAGLAHALGLPLLVIHDQSISRGIFDRGVLNSFLYQKDFKDDAWGMSKDIIGALSQWKNKLKPISKNTLFENEKKEKPSVKWGAFVFEGDESLYCPFCYNNKGLKMLTSRVDTRTRRCTSCGELLKS